MSYPRKDKKEKSVVLIQALIQTLRHPEGKLVFGNRK